MNESLDIIVRLLAIVVPVLMAVICGLIGWVWLLWQDHNKHKLYCAESMLKTGALQEVKDEIHGLRNIVYQIALKMDVPVFTEPYRR
ncbi:hypothetical protein [Lysobacter antibioticus]|uniref:Uncharacterized protein n=1 Tax=Lysobacter antibioticus TaxID=84531 RepID=A0A0S2F7H0_LYSAN|nr:hypothetical protein [Lysobacter antibioticus]ALN79494.1 hypothetical protein LA76x_1337 [Lysobacter antibioticus]